MDLLVKSLREFPEMLELREIVVDETMTCIGGNMRMLALRKIGAKECIAKIVTGLTPEQKREFIVKDNSGFGSWDMDSLSSSWTDLPLLDWGLDLPADWLKKVDDIDILNPDYNDMKDSKILCIMKNNLTKEFMDFLQEFAKKYKGMISYVNMSATELGKQN